MNSLIETSSSLGTSATEQNEAGLPTGNAGVAANHRDALAAKYYPNLWALIANRPGASKARQKVRKAAEACVKLEALAASGAKCASCRSFNTRPPFGLKMNSYCEAMSDFHGYVETKPDGLCIDWHPSSESATVNSQVGTPATETRLTE